MSATGEGEDDASDEDLGSPSDQLFRELARTPERLLPPSPAELVGTKIGRFEIVGILGQGGMGVVYRAKDTALGRVVALKGLLDADRFPKLRARFEREARAAARVEHPNIAKIYDLFDHEGRPYLAMQLVSGRTLRARLAEGRLELAEALSIARGIALGLACAHEARVVHRDLKPENVMIEPGGGVRILDFGLAKLFDAVSPAAAQATAMTTEGHIVGTLSYMAPEQTRGSDVDARSDVFAFGAVLYELVLGIKAFGRPTMAAVVRAIQEETPPIGATVPKPVAEILRRCLDKDPAARFASGREIVAALSSAREPLSTTGPRARLLWGAAIAIFALVVALALSGLR